MSQISLFVLLMGAGFCGVLFSEAEDYYDLMLNGKPVVRYMYAYDVSDKEATDRTYKPFLRVYGESGSQITKDHGGKFPHHRGIFLGWKVKLEGRTHDLWHMKDGAHQIHQEFLDQSKKHFVSLVHWTSGGDTPEVLLEEKRKVALRPMPDPAYAMLDFESTVTAVAGDLELGGDPEHAGLQFRPADHIDASQTMYFFPKPFEKGVLDMPWAGQTCVVDAKIYTILFMNHPDNPKGTKLSAYRDYGRFGFFPTKRLKKGESLVLRYRFILTEGKLHDASLVQELYNEFSGEQSKLSKLVMQSAETKKKKK